MGGSNDGWQPHGPNAGGHVPQPGDRRRSAKVAAGTLGFLMFTLGATAGCSGAGSDTNATEKVALVADAEPRTTVTTAAPATTTTPPTTAAPTTAPPTTVAPTTAPPTTPAPTVPPPTAPPETAPLPTAAFVPEAPSAYYANCTDARNAGVTPLYRGDPGYASKLDRDDDGVACE
ncbi:hypothetical protein BH10ACT1_BH10ACT1_17250 [soil metagenome]